MLPSGRNTQNTILKNIKTRKIQKISNFFKAGRVGTCSNGIFTLIRTVPHVRGRKCFLVVETAKTLFQKVQKVQKFQNSKNSHEQTRIRVSTCIYMYAYVYTAATCIYAFSWQNGVENGNPENFSLRV